MAENENPDFLTKQLITYIGNKRALLDFIGRGIEKVRLRLGREKISIFDVFSGSGIVARYCKQFADRLIVNDLEKYSEVINGCYLSNISDVPHKELRSLYTELKNSLDESSLTEGFITQLYSPEDENRIKPGERVFYTPRNARYIDTARLLIENIDSLYRSFFLAPLLSEASIHANTSGVFKGFYKDRGTGIGKYGGRNGDALVRIQGDIDLPFPVFSRFECDVDIHRGDANTIAGSLDEVDIAYLDPPYNQHPYGSNYFMLNLITDYIPPVYISPVSGIPADWNRSSYNSKVSAYRTFSRLIDSLNARFLLISFNSEGFIDTMEMQELLRRTGRLEVLETRYNTFRGSRNLRNRDIHVKEYLYLVEKNPG